MKLRQRQINRRLRHLTGRLTTPLPLRKQWIWQQRILKEQGIPRVLPREHQITVEHTRASQPRKGLVKAVVKLTVKSESTVSQWAGQLVEAGAVWVIVLKDVFERWTSDELVYACEGGGEDDIFGIFGWITGEAIVGETCDHITIY